MVSVDEEGDYLDLLGEILSAWQVWEISFLTWSAARSRRGSIFTSDNVGLRGLWV